MGRTDKFTAPGRGIVWLDTGHIVVDSDFNVLFVAGPRQNGDFDAFCAAFGWETAAKAINQGSDT
jgi:hypothetical protein